MNHITTFSSSHNEPQIQEEDGAVCQWDFALSSLISSDSSSSTDVIGAVAVDPTDSLLATAGIARKIRIYTLSSSSPSLDFFISTPAKLSTLRWAPPLAGGGAHIIGAADYDGVVAEYDLQHGLSVFERDEHSGRRIWSMDYSSSSATAASCADDCTAQVWDRRCGPESVAVISRDAAVCSVEFEKSGGYCIGLGCADRKAYIYDLRNVAVGPVMTFSGHERTVTYVRFAGEGRVVTSGVDGVHRMWDQNDGREIRVYRGHVNERSFVGMDVCKGGGLIGCGSESDEVFVYDLMWGEPIWVEGFGGNFVGEEGVGCNFERVGRFVSAVCWREVDGEDECGLVVGGSNGVVKIYNGKRRRRRRRD